MTKSLFIIGCVCVVAGLACGGTQGTPGVRAEGKVAEAGENAADTPGARSPGDAKGGAARAGNVCQAASAGGLLAAQGVACPVRSCLYHDGQAALAARYYQCNSGADGICFHYAGPCVPADKCMYDAARGAYRVCSAASEGVCAAFGDSCVPPGRCMYNTADRRHHRCQDAKDGVCTAFGAACLPTS